MAMRPRRWLERQTRERAEGQWRALAASTERLELGQLRRLRDEALGLRASLNHFLLGADRRARQDRVTLDALHLPGGTDWRWRPDFMAGPIQPRGIAGPHPGARLGEIEAIERDQWTVYSTYRPHRPLLRIPVDDAAGSVVYVSSRSGEVVALTTRFERGWSWLGTVPHWFYFTALRGDDTSLWRRLVLWLPPLALLTVLAGLALGLQRLRLRRRYPRGRVTPYQGLKRWHHLLGLGVGSLAFTWLLSGWLSNHPFGLLEFSGLPKGAAQRLAGIAFSPPENLTLLKRQLAAAPGGREAEWYRFDGRHYLEVRGSDGSRRLDDQARPAGPIPPATLAALIAAIEGKPVARAELIHEADLYHYGRRNPVVLPAVRIRLADAEDTTWYLDPANGRVLGRVDAANRLHRWVFNGLHRLDFPPLGALPALREGLITVLCLLGAALATSGCVMGVRRLRRRRPSQGNARPDQV